jgi:hypothetical protein
MTFESLGIAKVEVHRLSMTNVQIALIVRHCTLIIRTFGSGGNLSKYFPPVSCKCLARTSAELFTVFAVGGGKYSAASKVPSALVVLAARGVANNFSNSTRTTELQN